MRLAAASLTLTLVFARAGSLGALSLNEPLETDEGSARSQAMGSAFVGLADDTTAVLINPAGLATLGTLQVALDNDTWLVDTYQEQGLAAVPFGTAGTLGVGVDYMDFGSFSSRDAEGNVLPSVTASQTDLRVAWGISVLKGLSLGLGLRGGYATLAEVNQNSEAADVGLLWRALPGLRLGLAALDLGPAVDGAQQAMAVRGGGSYEIDLGPGEDLLLTAEGSIEPQAVNRVRVGAESWLYGHHLAFRAGYEADLADEQSGGSGLTAGLGLSVASIQVDYAYLPYGDLGASQRLDVSYAWAPAPAPAAAQPVSAMPTPQPSPGPNDLQLQFTLPGDPLERGHLLEQQGKLYDALTAYLDAIKANGRNPLAWRALGTVYYRLGQNGYALQCFEQELTLEPDNTALRAWIVKAKQTRADP